MRKFTTLLSGIVALVFLLIGCGSTADSDSPPMEMLPTITPGQLTIVNVMANEVPANAVNGAVYLTILNGTAQPVQLLSAQSAMAERITFHETINDNGVMHMTQPANGFAVGAGESLIFSPGKKHLMLENLQSPLKANMPFTLTLAFDNAETIVLTVPVLPLGSTGLTPAAMDHNQH